MAELADQGLDVGGDHRFVFDDQHFGRQFRVDLGLRLGDQLLHFLETGFEDLGGLAGREALERGEQEGLARAGRDTHEPMRCVLVARLGLVYRFLQLSAARAPDGVEHAIERHSGRKLGVERLLSRGQGLEGHPDIVVAGSLFPGQSPGVAADIWQMRR